MTAAAAPLAAPIVWQPQDGSQALFLACPIAECLYEGTRGPGKTDGLLMDFGQHVGQGHGAAWRGILFRETYKQLDDVVAKSKRWFHQIFPKAEFLSSKTDYKWVWPDGEELLLRHMETPDDYWNYHGHEYPWIGWEELTNWASLACYHAMKACWRSSYPGVPRKYRATANPFGVGHHAVKHYFVDPAPPGVVIRDPETGVERVRLHGHWSENRIMLAADPDYPRRLASDPDKNRRKAWLHGSWDVVAGGFFDDLWDRDIHVLRPFAIPASWRLDRSFDWGSSKPFSVGWWAESDGSEVTLADGTRRTFARGTLFRIAEWYGWTGEPNVGTKALAMDIAKGIVARERAMRQSYGWRVHPGPADTSIFDVENGMCLAEDMRKAGVTWERADKSPGSRKTGWEKLRQRLHAARTAPKEEPGLFVFDTCTQFIRTVPTLPRDPVKIDDVHSAAEDHVADETRYRLLDPRREWRTSHFAL